MAGVAKTQHHAHARHFVDYRAASRTKPGVAVHTSAPASVVAILGAEHPANPELVQSLHAAWVVLNGSPPFNVHADPQVTACLAENGRASCRERMGQDGEN